MNEVSTKLQECLALSMGGTFPEFVSNAIIVDDKIHMHKESKKRKVVAASSSSAPLKYWCTILLTPPTSCVSTSSSSGLPTHLSVHTNR
jgi:hypothetical protein